MHHGPRWIGEYLATRDLESDTDRSCTLPARMTDSRSGGSSRNRSRVPLKRLAKISLQKRDEWRNYLGVNRLLYGRIEEICSSILSGQLLHYDGSRCSIDTQVQQSLKLYTESSPQQALAC